MKKKMYHPLGPQSIPSNSSDWSQCNTSTNLLDVSELSTLLRQSPSAESQIKNRRSCCTRHAGIFINFIANSPSSWWPSHFVSGQLLQTIHRQIHPFSPADTQRQLHTTTMRFLQRMKNMCSLDELHNLNFSLIHRADNSTLENKYLSIWWTKKKSFKSLDNNSKQCRINNEIYRIRIRWHRGFLSRILPKLRYIIRN